MLKDYLKHLEEIEENHFFIPKLSEIPASSVKKDSAYIIEVLDHVRFPDFSSTLASNWNSGKVPKYQFYEVECVAKMGEMYQFNGIPIVNGERLYSENFYQWLPENGFKVKEKLM